MPAGISALAPASAAASTGPGMELAASAASKAFTILQKDGLDSTLPLLHVNGDESEEEEDEEEDDDSDASKLTMIRRNVRNNDSSVFAHKPLQQLSKSSEQLGQHQQHNHHHQHHQLSHHLSKPGGRLHCRNYSKSQGNLNREERRLPAACCKSHSMHLSTEDFNEALSAKLRKIQEQEEEEEQRRLAGCRSSHVQHPKPFITTVKTGEFLRPPPEVALLLGIGPNSASGSGSEDLDVHCRSRIRQHLTQLSRRPEARHQQSHNAGRCQVALKATEDFGSAITSASRNSKRDSHHTSSSLTPRAFPKKLEPIDGTMNKQPTPWDPPPAFGNLMFDRRILPTNSFAAAVNVGDCTKSQAAKSQETTRRQICRKRAQILSSLTRLGTPPPVPGRKHEPVQTELYLEELFEKPDESEAAVQTDYFLDRPETPPYCPGKTGIDVGTQVEPGDLFDYDVEVQPILEVLVGKTIEQALMEVLEEEEIASLREQQRKFVELRAAEKAEQQRLEEQDRRIREEKDRRVRQHEEAVKAQLETEERVAATVLLTGYIAELLPAVLENLKISGFLLDEIKADVEEEFMPWLMKEVKKEVGTIIDSREILEEIIAEIIENRAKIYKHLGEEYDANRKLKTDRIEIACGEEYLDDGSENDSEHKRSK